jgi:hypothetical protein
MESPKRLLRDLKTSLKDFIRYQPLMLVAADVLIKFSNFL